MIRPASRPASQGMPILAAPLSASSQQNGASAQKEGKPKIKPILTKALTDTLDGRLNWRHEQETRGLELVDTFSARRKDVNIQLKATRPLADKAETPQRLGNWELKLEKSGKRPAILDGGQLHLPQSVSEQTDTADNIIPKLFKTVYDVAAQQFDPLQAKLAGFLDKLTRGEMICSLTRLKPDFRYNLPTGAKIVQVGEGDERLEISRIGNALRIKIHQGKQVERHSELALRNETVKEALNALLEEVFLQRTGKTGKGLASF